MKKVEITTIEVKPPEPALIDEESVAVSTTAKKLVERHSRIPILVEAHRDEESQERANVYEENSRSIQVEL